MIQITNTWPREIVEVRLRRNTKPEGIIFNNTQGQQVLITWDSALGKAIFTNVSGLLAGNVDWQCPTSMGIRAISWSGPHDRYFADFVGSPNVYHAGKLLCVAPEIVKGATCYNKVKLIIVGISGTIYARDVQVVNRVIKLASQEWQVVGCVSPPLGNHPWFFNAAGDKAVCVSASGSLHRLGLNENCTGLSTSIVAPVESETSHDYGRYGSRYYYIATDFKGSYEATLSAILTYMYSHMYSNLAEDRWLYLYLNNYLNNYRFTAFYRN